MIEQTHSCDIRRPRSHTSKTAQIISLGHVIEPTHSCDMTPCNFCTPSLSRESNTRLFLTRKPCCRKETARSPKPVLFGLKFANEIHYKLRCSQASIKQGFRTPNILEHCVVWPSSMRCLVQPRCTGFHDTILTVQSRFAETRFAETPTLTLSLNPNP